MNRRTLLRQLGSAALATTALAGTSMASRSGGDGPTLLSDVLDDEELAALDDDVDPESIHVVDGFGPHYVDPYECAIGCCETPLPCPGDCDTCSCVNCY